MTQECSGAVTEQNRLLSRLLSLRYSGGDEDKAGETSRTSKTQDEVLVQVSDQVPAGRGLVFTQPVDPGQVVLTLPADSLLNVKSYKAFFHPDTLPAAVGVAGSVGKSDRRLSSAQLLSLLVARAQVESVLEIHAREPSTATPKHEALRLFVKTLPVEFETVPLVWSVQAVDVDPSATPSHAKSETPDAPAASWKRHFFRSLLEALPRHSRGLERTVRKRFEKDWNRICEMRDSDCDMLAEPALLSSNPDFARRIVRSIDLDLFLWAWLCINSRCVFLPLGLADHADNFTLAPMLDMANHTPDPALECKVRYANDGGLELCAPVQPPQPSSTSQPRTISTGDECFITYGPHSNESLLSEYGFVLPPELSFHGDASGPVSVDRSGRTWHGSRYVDVLMDQEVETMLAAQGSGGEAKIELLQNRGYWGEFTIHPYPEPAHPSHRLIPALRLAALDIDETASQPSQSHKVAKLKTYPGVKAGKKSVHQFQARSGPSDLDLWDETLTGYRENVSDENELHAHNLLVDLCNARSTYTDAALQHLATAQAILDDAPEAGAYSARASRSPRMEPERSGCLQSLAFVKQLLDEEASVLSMVSKAAQEQVEW